MVFFFFHNFFFFHFRLIISIFFSSKQTNRGWRKWTNWEKKRVIRKEKKKSYTELYLLERLCLQTPTSMNLNGFKLEPRHLFSCIITSKLGTAPHLEIHCNKHLLQHIPTSDVDKMPKQKKVEHETNFQNTLIATA